MGRRAKKDMQTVITQASEAELVATSFWKRQDLYISGKAVQVR